MSPSAPHGKHRDLTHIARAVVEHFDAAPGAAVAAAAWREGGWVHGWGAFGRLEAERGEPVTIETPFDLASLTKPITALTLARLERRGVVRRQEKLGALVPRWADTRAGAMSLDLLTAHRAGLEAHLPLYAPLAGGSVVEREPSLRAAADAIRPECAPPAPGEGFPAVYSDLGYLLTGVALEERAGQSLDELMATEITTPLGLRIGSARRMRSRDPLFERRVAPTERVEWRGGLVRGVVHDENAWALVGDAAAGHAGLFGDARSVARLGAKVIEILRGGDEGFLTPAEMDPLVRLRPNGSHRAGFDGKSGDAPSSGARFGDRTFGHLGFTGTSLWIDPDDGLVGVLLTNRVCPTREHIAIRQARPATYDALFEEMR